MSFLVDLIEVLAHRLVQRRMVILDRHDIVSTTIDDISEIMGLGSINPGIFDRRHALDQTQLCNHSMDSSKRKGSVSDVFRC